MYTLLEKFWCALFVTSGWHEMWVKYSDSNSNRMRRFALKCKMISIIEFDRTINSYDLIFSDPEKLKDVFIYPDEDSV